jgi:chloramphenicol-sensitive protein RarD
VRRGIWFAVGAYVVWGMFPVYWRQLRHVPAIELICHRVVWSYLMLVLVILLRRQWASFRSAVLKPSIFMAYSAASLLIGINWLTYIWAVNAGFIVETSLGYFINPIISVVLGVVFLRERLRPFQWLPVGLAAAGVLFLTFVYGALPWIALTLAVTFAAYGLVKKTSPLGSLHGLTLETAILFPPSILYLLYVDRARGSIVLGDGVAASLMLVGTGVATAVPLLLFASAARRIPLTTIGLLQYIAPTIQFLIGVLLYNEPFTRSQLVGFGMVWTALVIFAFEGFVARRAAVPQSAVNEFL